MSSPSPRPFTLMDAMVLDAATAIGLGALRAAVGDFTELRHQLTESGSLPELRSLTLQDTRVTDSGMKQIGQLSDLRSLELDGVLVTDVGLMELASLEHPESLSLRDTPVTSDGLMRLKSHPYPRSTTVLTPSIDDDTFQKRRSRRRGFAGRLRLAWRSLKQKDEPQFVCGTVLMRRPEELRHPGMVAGGAAVSISPGEEAASLSTSAAYY